MKSNKKIIVAVTIIIVFLFVYFLAFVLLDKDNQGRNILKGAIEKIDKRLSSGEVLVENYRLRFNGPGYDQSRTAFESFKGGIKHVSPNLTVVRKESPTAYLFTGHFRKNNYYDRFTIKKKDLHKEKDIDVIILANTFVSRGLSMYAAYGPREFWKLTMKKMLQAKTLNFEYTSTVFKYEYNLDKDNKVFLVLDRITLLPLELRVEKSNKGNPHAIEYKKLTLKVKKSEIVDFEKDMFEIEIPEDYMVRKLIFKKLAHDEDSEGKELCNSCHEKDLMITRFEKK